MRTGLWGVLYVGCAAALGVAVRQYRFERCFAVPSDCKPCAINAASQQADAGLRQLSRAEQTVQSRWRVGVFFIGLSLVNFVCVGGALYDGNADALYNDGNANASLLGATIGSVPVTVFGCYHWRQSTVALREIAQRRASFWDAKYVKGWVLQRR